MTGRPATVLQPSTGASCQRVWEWKQGRGDDRLCTLINPEIYFSNAQDDYLLLELYLGRERLIEDFEILPGLVIPAGDYRYDSVMLYAGIGAQRLLSGDFTLHFGEFYDGRREDYAVETVLAPIRPGG